MARSRPHEIEADEALVEADAPARADTFAERGRAVLDHLPGVVSGARESLDGAQEQVNGLSDLGIVAASGFALGLNAGLVLAGAPRLVVVGCSTISVLLTFRSAMGRVARPGRLLD